MKILVISLAGIGDTVIATPFLHELRAQFPDATIDVFLFWPGARDLLEGNPHLNQIFQCHLIKAGALRSLQFLLQLRRRRYDISINTHPQSRLAYRAIAWLIGAPIRLSHLYDHSGWLDRWFVNRTMPQDYSVHVVENNLRLLNLLNKKPILPHHAIEIFPGASELKWADDYIAAHQLQDKISLGMHVGSGGTKNLRMKRWPLDCYRELIRRLLDKHPQLTLLLFGGPEEEEDHAQILNDNPATSRILFPKTGNFRLAAALLQRCHAFLSVDTVLMHLATAMKVPNQLLIEAPTLNITNVPYGNPYRLIENPAVHGRTLEYYRYDGGPLRGTDEELIRCMRAVTVDAVEQAVVEALGLNAKPRAG